jgi:hypothetical protein
MLIRTATSGDIEPSFFVVLSYMMYKYGSLVYIEILCLSMAIALPLFLSIHIKYVLFNTTTNEDIRREAVVSSINKDINDLKRLQRKELNEEKRKELLGKIKTKDKELSEARRYKFYKSIAQSIRDVLY